LLPKETSGLPVRASSEINRPSEVASRMRRASTDPPPFGRATVPCQ
jgi:hypothetical protein